jgi:hypothetical protein
MRYGAIVLNSNDKNTELVEATPAFEGLSPEECRYLRKWQRAARVAGIDSMEDLKGRAWPCDVDGAVIGVFMAGDQAASWLVVKHNGSWAVACCADFTVSEPVPTLAEALQRLHPWFPGFGASE